MRLLAKTPKSGQEKGLVEHSREVMEAFEALFGERHVPTRLGCEWFRFFCLDDSHYTAFYTNGVAACGLHDLGKASDGFQNAVRGKGSQLLRHEHLSGLILA
jgi:CRISPR-associated endonuclease/helicase Cas3